MRKRSTIRRSSCLGNYILAYLFELLHSQYGSEGLCTSCCDCYTLAVWLLAQSSKSDICNNGMAKRNVFGSHTISTWFVSRSPLHIFICICLSLSFHILLIVMYHKRQNCPCKCRKDAWRCGVIVPHIFISSLPGMSGHFHTQVALPFRNPRY